MFQIIVIKPNEFDINSIPFKSESNKKYNEITRNDFFDIKSNYVDFDKFKEIFFRELYPSFPVKAFACLVLIRMP